MKKNALLDMIENTTLNSSQEQALIDSAIKELYIKKNKSAVLSNLKREFSKLAMQQKLSAEGVQFLSKINRPDFNIDMAKSSTTWF